MSPKYFLDWIRIVDFLLKVKCLTSSDLFASVSNFHFIKLGQETPKFKNWFQKLPRRSTPRQSRQLESPLYNGGKNRTLSFFKDRLTMTLLCTYYSKGKQFLKMVFISCLTLRQWFWKCTFKFGAEW